jgi:GAF domain-containing protein
MRKEQLRLNATKRYLKLDLNSKGKLDSIVMLASHITQSPVAFITLMDKEVQWMRSCHGYQVEQMPRDTSFCKHTIDQDDVFVVNDTFEDKAFAQYPVVNSNPAARFYAGAPLRSFDGHNVGTLCVLDIKPHEMTEDQIACLKALSKQVAAIMELDLGKSLLEKTVEEVEQKNREIELQNKQLRAIAQMQSHEFRGPLSSVMGLMNLIKHDDYTASKDYLIMMETAVNKLDEKICGVVKLASKVA